MATSKAAHKVDQAIKHDDSATVKQDVSNPALDRDRYADPSGEKMKALVWLGKNKVEVRTYHIPCPPPFSSYSEERYNTTLTPTPEEVPKPRIVEPRDVILRVTGTTVCGSDLHLLHGSIMQMQKGDILGHEFCGVVDAVGPGITRIAPGQRVVASFQIACGDCMYCKKKQSSQCERTSGNSKAAGLYGAQTA